MSQYVVWYDSSEVGAPILNNTAGSLIGVLDACLVNGFNLKSITSLVVAGGVATATCNSHGYSGKYSQDIVLAGCNTAALNGRKQLTYVDTNTVRFDATGVADQTATGTITAKRDALGWVKQFTGTNKAIYKRSDVTASSVMLRVLDTAVAPASTTYARWFSVETATDVDTYTGQAPTQAALADGQWVNKGADTTAVKQWTLVGDGKSFYLLTMTGSSVLPALNGGAAVHFFGDFISYKAGDAYNTMISGGYSNSGTGGVMYGYGVGRISAWLTAPSAPTSLQIARRYTQLAGPVGANLCGTGTGTPGDGGQCVYPSPIDGGFCMVQGLAICEDDASSRYPVRGSLPSFMTFMAASPVVHQAIISGVGALTGRSILGVQTSIVGAAGATWGIDITGPWL